MEIRADFPCLNIDKVRIFKVFCNSVGLVGNFFFFFAAKEPKWSYYKTEQPNEGNQKQTEVSYLTDDLN